MEDRLELEQRETSALKDRIETLSDELKESSPQAAFDNVETNGSAVNSDDSNDHADNTDSLPTLNEADLERHGHNGSGKGDLQKIKGVGAKLEQKLNMLGIVNFRNLLELGQEDYDRAQELIPSLISRVERDA